MDQWNAVLLRRWRNGILPSMWKAGKVRHRPNGPVADRVTTKLKAVLDKNLGFYVLKQVCNALSGADSKIPGEIRASKVPDYNISDKRKLSLAIALIGAPSLVFLDEPLKGVDTGTSQKFFDILRHVRSRAKATTIIYASVR
ncbi:hypothetical protein HPB50_025425 [Hyalomma asiaticum]|uniref:Uncharacterized protein n=1 Tax=Hyalomma asiaticum TaxID=266040 RepID=A0ACB7SIV0_HYAAI|nr:hypothetical protein HPB50_025425 [Hyalomma asiaticum]